MQHADVRSAARPGTHNHTIVPWHDDLTDANAIRPFCYRQERRYDVVFGRSQVNRGAVIAQTTRRLRADKRRLPEFQRYAVITGQTAWPSLPLQLVMKCTETITMKLQLRALSREILADSSGLTDSFPCTSGVEYEFGRDTVGPATTRSISRRQ